jgi:hypothetical protein
VGSHYDVDEKFMAQFLFSIFIVKFSEYFTIDIHFARRALKQRQCEKFCAEQGKKITVWHIMMRFIC